MKQISFLPRLLFGFMLVVFGLNKFFNFLPMGELPVEAADIIQGLVQAPYLMPMIGVIMLLSGLSILMNAYAALMLVVLAPIVVNITLFNIFYNQEGIAVSAIMLILHLLLFGIYKDSYASLCMACSGCGCSTKKK